jgi:hypothetical protein
MRLPEDDLLDIQCFVYFLFKGTIHPTLIAHNCEYTYHLVREPAQLENVFRLFTEALRQHPLGGRADNRAEEYLVAQYVNKDREQAQALLATLPQEQPNDVYAHFFQLAQQFIHNTFADPIQSPEYLRDLDGLGVIAVPPFALWTNVVNAPAPDEATAYARALRRANDRVRLMYDGQEPEEPFQDWEIEQEIY